MMKNKVRGTAKIKIGGINLTFRITATIIIISNSFFQIIAVLLAKRNTLPLFSPSFYIPKRLLAVLVFWFYRGNMKWVLLENG
jgi:hypothetical protein